MKRKRGENLSKIRVYQVAKELNVSSKDIITKLADLKIEVNNHMSTLEDNEVALIHKIFSKSDSKQKAEQNMTSKKPEPNHEENHDQKKSPSWTIGTPKVNRPKRKSDFQSRNKNKPNPQDTHRPKSKVEQQLENIKTQVPKNAPQKPVQAVEKPVEKPVVKPVVEEKPVVENTPVQTSAPENIVATPVEKPVESKPIENKVHHDSNTARKQEHSNKPYDGNKKPYDGTKKPYDGTKKPYDGTKKPYDGTKKPYDGQKKPYDGTKKPYDGTKKPYDGQKKPYDPSKKNSDSKPPYNNQRDSSTSNRSQGDYSSRPNNNDNRGGNKPFDKNAKSFTKKVEPMPVETIAPEKENRKKVNKVKKKKVDTRFEKDASLEEKFSKKVKNKKKKRTDRAFDNSKYFDVEGNLLIPQQVSVGTFAEMLGQPVSDVIMKLMSTGIMANVNQEIEFETAELIAMEFEIPCKLLVPVDETDELIESFFEDNNESELTLRPPVVTVMGHVDHGKTSLLDAIRETAVTDREAGGITQHIGASEATINGQKIVFLDTPGHEAFTTLRARGAQVTDIAVLVVAADDGVMPQTIEAIDHAKAAGVPIIVAINKIDKPGCNPDQVKSELSEHGIVVEDWGGDVISVEVSALKKINIEGLLEMILLQAEVLELKANANRHATGTIIDAKVDKGRGIVTTLLIQNGTLKIGDSIVCGSAHGRVRAMYNHVNKRIKEAGPSSGVEITGLTEIPVAGDRFFVVGDDKLARQLAERKQLEERNVALKSTPQHVTLEDIFDRIQAGKTKEIKIVIKADVQGSLEALKTSLVRLSNEEVTVNVIHSAVGTVTESDVLLASASDAIIIGFNVRPITVVEQLAIQEGVELKTYRIIYEAINDVSDALIGMLDPVYKEEILGKVEVRQTIKVPNIGMIAGCYVLTGKVTRNAEFRLIREGIVVHEGKISSLKRFKDDVKEVATGYECGIGFESFNDMKEGDIIEAFEMVEIKRKK
ncbi:MAG: translation initiation factor IF-2 [Clostridia bacterium]|nr:translation initiation factor IF-2 [Clostridia bacterium]